MARLAKPSRPFMHDNDHRGFFNVQHRLLQSVTLVRGGDTSTKQRAHKGDAVPPTFLRNNTRSQAEGRVGKPAWGKLRTLSPAS